MRADGRRSRGFLSQAVSVRRRRSWMLFEAGRAARCDGGAGEGEISREPKYVPCRGNCGASRPCRDLSGSGAVFRWPWQRRIGGCRGEAAGRGFSLRGRAEAECRSRRLWAGFCGCGEGGTDLILPDQVRRCPGRREELDACGTRQGDGEQDQVLRFRRRRLITIWPWPWRPGNAGGH